MKTQRSASPLLYLAAGALAGALTVSGALHVIAPAAAQEAEAENRGTFVLSITSGLEDPHAVTMALQLAQHALDDKREVVLFFNVRGVVVPSEDLPDDVAFHAKSIKGLLHELLRQGASVQVCPHCMDAMNISEHDLVRGAEVTSREKLFGALDEKAVVFTY
jgi:predicted peroxiredoxin